MLLSISFFAFLSIKPRPNKSLNKIVHDTEIHTVFYLNQHYNYLFLSYLLFTSL